MAAGDSSQADGHRSRLDFTALGPGFAALDPGVLFEMRHAAHVTLCL
jgi:hypothetical protein